MIIGKPAPFVRAFVDAVDEAIRAQSPSYGLSTMQRTWLAFCVTAVLVTNSICWARFERASLGLYSLAALSWMFRHSKIPWDDLLVASVRVILRHYGITAGSLVIGSCPCSLRINQTGHLLIAHLPPHAPFDGGSASREAETTTGVCNLACNERQPPSATHKMNIYLYFCLCYGCLSRCGQSVVQRSTTSTCPGQPACISRWDKPPKKLAWTSPPSQSD